MAMTAAIVVAVIWVFVRHLPTANRFRGIFLKAATSKEAGYISGTTRDDLVGHDGVALTDLRPAGTVRIDGERIDAVSDIGFIEQGRRVRVIRSESYRHVVEPISDGADSTPSPVEE
jgi:membrane-bound serine protease (ClpP class)